MKNINRRSNIKYILFILIVFVLLLTNIKIINAEEDENENDTGEKITLGEATKNYSAHSFKYENFTIADSVNPQSLSISIKNGTFNVDSTTISSLSTYFDFKGGTLSNNSFTSYLDSTNSYKLISLNINSNVDVTNEDTLADVLSVIETFIRKINFKNDVLKNAEFSVTLSDVVMKLDSATNNLGTGTSDLSVVAFKGPDHRSEHYYMKVVNPQIKWTASYNIAAGLTFNGLQGYLVTITSEEEHNFIYQSLGPIKGWMGAAFVEDADSYNYNTQNIEWKDAMSKSTHSVGHGTNSANDLILEEYWRWVAGPEAGTKVFGLGKYSNFASGEPNNYADAGEWCGEYGHGTGGVWNDYPNYERNIEGYYVEFGGFENDEEINKPVTLTESFKWSEYDKENMEEYFEPEKVYSFTAFDSETKLKEKVDEEINRIQVYSPNYTFTEIEYPEDDKLRVKAVMEFEDGTTYEFIVEKQLVNKFRVLSENSSANMQGVFSDTKYKVGQKALTATDKLTEEDVDITLKTLPSTATDEDKELFKEKMSDDSKIVYMDLELYKKIGDTETQIDEAEDEIEVGIKVSGELKNTNRKKLRIYKVLRMHNGIVDELETITDYNSDTVKFKTKLFSEYAIYYYDIDNPLSFDSTIIYIVISIISLSLIFVLPRLIKKIN